MKVSIPGPKGPTAGTRPARGGAIGRTAGSWSAGPCQLAPLPRLRRVLPRLRGGESGTLHSEVGSCDVFGLEQFLACACLDDRAGLQHVAAVSHVQGLLRLLLNKE